LEAGASLEASAGIEARADANVAFSYALSTLTAGLPPQTIDFEEAMDLVRLEGEDHKTYAFNSKNTRITKKAGCNLSNAARRRTVTLKKSVCTGHFRYPAIMSAKTP